jgi:hypothetical protein
MKRGVQVRDARNNVTRPRLHLTRALQRWGFAWADQPQTASYTPQTNYQGNSEGLTNRVTREGVGNYLVRMPRLAGVSTGTGFAQAYGRSATRCKVGAWHSSARDLLLRVYCHDFSGNRADSRFVAQWFADDIGSNTLDNGYVWSDQPTWAFYTPYPEFQMNSKHTLNTVERQGTGRYVVTFPGFNRGGGNVQVNAFGEDASYCKVEAWSDTQSVVLCFDNFGRPVDSRFTTMRRDQSLPVTGRGGYAWANETDNTNWYTPSAPWNFGTNGAAAARKVGTGQYEVRFPNMPSFNDTTVLVTGYGSDNTHCNAEGWSASGLDTIVRVTCSGPWLGFADSRFSVQYLTTWT